MIEWTDKSDRKSRFYVGEAESAEPVDTVAAVHSMFSLMQQQILGAGNATDYDILMFEVNCDSGRLVAGATTKDGWPLNKIDGCSVRVQEVQDFWYDVIESGIAEADLPGAIKLKVLEVGRLFHDLVVRSAEELLSKAGQYGFTFIVFGSNRGEVIQRLSFR